MTQTPSGDSITPTARALATEDVPVTTVRRPSTGDDGIVVTRSSRGKKISIYAALIFFALLYIYPFIVQVSTSFKTNADAVANPLAIVPDPITTAAFERSPETDFPRGSATRCSSRCSSPSGGSSSTRWPATRWPG